MRRAFTLIELLIVLVMVALVAAMVLPSIAVAKEEDRKAQCRANLRTIGMAIAMYAKDKDGWTPEMGGNRNYFTSDGKFDEPPDDPATVFGTMYSNAGIMSINATVGQPQKWLATASAPARPIGLGLLWSCGYLTDKGAQCLYCPDNNSAARSSKLGKDKLQRYDADEPFWTSGGRVVRADGDGTGDNGTGGGFHQDESPKGYYHFVGCGSEIMGKPGYVRTRYCQVWLNYSIRMLKKHMVYRGRSVAFPTAIKLPDAGKVGLVTDTLEMERGHWRPWGNFPGPYPNDEAVTSDANVRRTLSYRITNHDNAYNVLFADGTVKTFVDSKKRLIRAFCVVWNHKPNDNWRYTHNLYTHEKTTEDDFFFWKMFLDRAGGKTQE